MDSSTNRSCSTRREVLMAAIAGGLTWPARLRASAKPSQEWKIGCGTVNFRQRPLQEALERIRHAGYKYVETQAVGPWCPHVDVWHDDPTHFRDMVRNFGFHSVTGLWSPNGAIMSDAKSVEGITQTIRWAKEANIPIVHAGDGRNTGNISEKDASALLQDRLAQILEVAEQNQIHVAIEPHGTFSLTAYGLRKILALSTSKWLGINYDMANVHRATYANGAPGAISFSVYGQRQDEVKTLEAVADRVIHTHCKDLIGARCVPLGEGSVNIRGCIQILKTRNYSGVYSVETEGDLDADGTQTLIEKSRSYLKRVLTEA